MNEWLKWLALTGLTALTVSQAPAMAQGPSAQICNEGDRVIRYARTQGAGEWVRDASRPLGGRIVVSRKAEGWWTLQPGRCRGTSTGVLVDPSWHAFVDEDWNPLIFRPTRSVYYEEMPETICYASSQDVLDQYAEDIIFFGTNYGQSYYIEQDGSCDKPGHIEYPVSFGVFASGNTTFTISLE
jgi:hypothetical protein